MALLHHLSWISFFGRSRRSGYFFRVVILPSGFSRLRRRSVLTGRSNTWFCCSARCWKPVGWLLLYGFRGPELMARAQPQPQPPKCGFLVRFPGLMARAQPQPQPPNVGFWCLQPWAYGSSFAPASRCAITNVSPRYKTKFANEQPISKPTSAAFSEHL